MKIDLIAELEAELAVTSPEPGRDAVPDDWPNVSAATLATFLALSPNRITQLSREGVLPREAGRYPLRQSVRAYTEYARAHPMGRPSTAQPKVDSPAADRLKEAQADLAELKLEIGRGELLKAREVLAAWTGLAADLRGLLLAIPERVAQSLGLDRAQTLALDTEMRQALTALVSDPVLRGDAPASPQEGQP